MKWFCYFFCVSFFFLSHAYDNSDHKEDDDIPVRLFWEGNQARTDDFLHTIKKQLAVARRVKIIYIYILYILKHACSRQFPFFSTPDLGVCCGYTFSELFFFLVHSRAPVVHTNALGEKIIKFPRRGLK